MPEIEKLIDSVQLWSKDPQNTQQLATIIEEMEQKQEIKHSKSNSFPYSIVKLSHNSFVLITARESGGLLGKGKFGRVKICFSIAMENSKPLLEANVPQAVKILKNKSRKNLSFFDFQERVALESDFVSLAYSYPSKTTFRKVDKSKYREVSYLLMPFLEGEILENFLIKNNKTLTVGERFEIAFLFLDALEALHAKGIIHKDLSSANINIKKLSKGFSVVIFDFNLSKKIQDEKIYPRGNSLTCAPDVLQERDNVEGDVYGAGTILGEIFGGQWDDISRFKLEFLSQKKGKECLFACRDYKGIFPNLPESDFKNQVISILSSIDKPYKRRPTIPILREKLKMAYDLYERNTPKTVVSNNNNIFFNSEKPFEEIPKHKPTQPPELSTRSPL